MWSQTRSGVAETESCSEIKLLYYPPIMENQMEKQMENEMETGGIWGFKELKLSY